MKNINPMYMIHWNFHHHQHHYSFSFSCFFYSVVFIIDSISDWFYYFYSRETSSSSFNCCSSWKVYYIEHKIWEKIHSKIEATKEPRTNREQPVLFVVVVPREFFFSFFLHQIFFIIIIIIISESLCTIGSGIHYIDR